MNITSLLGKFQRNAREGHRITVIVQPSELYFSAVSDSGLPSKLRVEGEGWQEVLINALKESKLADIVLDIVLSSNFYQTYQIEKPNIPQEELSGALPFLIKELISEKVTEIVADSAHLPLSNKLLVYVASKSVILGLQQSLLTHHIQLDRVMVEDEIWGVSADEASHFLLLQRSYQNSFRLSAFVDHHCAFQRTIRGVSSPLTGVATSALQMDGIALELQRSIDYLSSQLRGTSLHQMKVCCDEEDNQELVDALNERLNVKVEALNETEIESGNVLLNYIHQINDSVVNLYSDALKPKVEYFTLPKVIGSWGALTLCFLIGFGFLHFKEMEFAKLLERQKQQEASLRQELSALVEQLPEHKPSPAKIAAVNRLKLELQANRASLKAVGEFDQTQQEGYSGTMRSLSKLSRQDISLNRIYIDHQKMDLHGLARDAKSIPSWVKQFKSEVNLVGRSFDKLRIGRNDDNIITFELLTRQEQN
ncbi:MSHA biogenesis protein MshI [Vibrio ostreicida]|uniref:MSHA biogenesis protein MshI n=1 Tax=Vibrio ostreicida TaxID=526588 RepID=A0ABT8BPW5_9VIBR|nr:MSHA biogenesis protein MshI [Vibrio ostreicida]MDN3608300.1 MSHA biogenesis protein MshI [Vibrio ostreicida]NPD09716.1 MSHA biogenesis protein MshI [Vibrio ostreicida]